MDQTTRKKQQQTTNEMSHMFGVSTFENLVSLLLRHICIKNTLKMILISNMMKIIIKKIKCIFHVFLHKFYFLI